MNTKLRKLIKNDNSQAILAKYTGVAFSFLLQSFIVWVLGAGKYGEYIQIIALANILGTFIAFGQMTYLTKNIAVALEEDKVSRVVRFLFSSMLISALIFLLVFISIVTIAELLPATNTWIDNRNDVAILSMLSAVVASQRIISGANRGLGKGVFDLININLLKPLLQVVLLGLIFLFLRANGLSLGIAIAVLLIASLCSIVLGYRVIKKAIFSSQPAESNIQSSFIAFKPSNGFLALIDQCKKSLSYTALNVVTALEKNIDVLIVGSLLGAESAGIYGFVSRLNRLTNVAQNALNVIFAPKAASKYSQSDVAGLAKLAKINIIITASSAFVFFLFFIFFGETILSSVNTDLSVGFIPLLILSFFGIIKSIAGPVSVTANMTNNEVQALRITVLTLFIGSVLIYFATDLIGIIGTACAVSLSSLMRAWGLRFMLNRRLRLDSISTSA